MKEETVHGIAIIGTGAIADQHIEGFLRDGRCQVKALCNTTTEKCIRLSSKYGLSADITDDYRTLLERKDIDIVSICLPPALHEEAAEAFLRNGKHVLIEKPMALSLEEEDRMIKTAGENGKLLSVIFQKRYLPSFWKARKMLRDGVFGKILSVNVTAHQYRGVHYHDVYWRGTWESEGGGVLINQAIHQVDLLNWFMGGLPLSITAMFANAIHTQSEAEDNGFAMLSYPGNITAGLSVSLCDMNEYQGLEFQCEKASFTVPDWSVHCVKPQPNGFPIRDEEAEQRFQEIYESTPTPEESGHTAQIKNFVDAVEGKSGLEITAEDGRNASEFVSAFYMSAALKRTVNFPLSPSDPVFTLRGLVETMPRFGRKTISTKNAGGPISFGTGS